MKKIDLIHTVILIVALLNAYSALEYFMRFISSLFYGVDLYHWQIPAAAISNLIITGVFFGACVLLVKNGRKYASALLPNEEEASWDNATEWQLDRRNIIFVFFIGMGLYTLIQAIPYVVDHLFEFFTSNVSSGFSSRQEKNGSRGSELLLIELLRTTIGALLIYAAPTLTNYIEKAIAVRLDGESQRR